MNLKCGWVPTCVHGTAEPKGTTDLKCGQALGARVFGRPARVACPWPVVMKMLSDEVPPHTPLFFSKHKQPPPPSPPKNKHPHSSMKGRSLNLTLDISVELAFGMEVVEAVEDFADDDGNVIFRERTGFHKVQS